MNDVLLVGPVERVARDIYLGLQDFEEFVLVGRIIDPGRRFGDDADMGDDFGGMRLGPVLRRDEAAAGIIFGAEIFWAQIAESRVALELRLRIERIGQHGSVDGAGLEGGEAGAARAGILELIVAVFHAVGACHHACVIDRIVLGAADNDGLSFEVGPGLDIGLGHQAIVQRRHDLVRNQNERRAAHFDDLDDIVERALAGFDRSGEKHLANMRRLLSDDILDVEIFFSKETFGIGDEIGRRREGYSRSRIMERRHLR